MKNSEEEIQKFLEDITVGTSNKKLMWTAIQIKIIIALIQARIKIKKFFT